MKHNRDFHTQIFEVKRLEEYTAGQVSAAPFYQPLVYELIWVKKGKGYYSVDLEKRRFSDHTLYCIVPGQIHRFQPEEKPTGYQVTFSDAFFRKNCSFRDLPFLLRGIAKKNMPPVISLNPEVEMEMEYIVSTMIWEYEKENHYKTEILHGLLKILIAELSCRFDYPVHGQENMHAGEMNSRFMALLETGFTRWKQVADYASELAVSPSYLSQIVKQVSGFPASYHIQQRILLEAQRIAISQNGSMKNIAFNLGFDDPSTFSKFFKKCAGTNFTEFRRQFCR